MQKNDWKIFKGDGVKKENYTIPEAPPFRKKGSKKIYVPDLESKEIDIVNASIYLKRPILVTGDPGVGKSSLAYAIADELGLELVKWEIGTKTVLTDGLYSYDAIARLQAASLQESIDINKYLFLGPLGYAFSVTEKPVVLLIDEIDKSDIDLPNDLLHIFEEMEFSITELERVDEKGEGIDIYPLHKKSISNPIKIFNGRVLLKEAKNFPIVIMTSNDEREFPPAFLRRCLRLDMQPPKEERLKEIIEKHFNIAKEELEQNKQISEVLEEFLKLRDEDAKTLSTDQLLSAIELVFKGAMNKKLLNEILKPLE